VAAQCLRSFTMSEKSAITAKQRGQATFYATAQIFPTYELQNNFAQTQNRKTRTAKPKYKSERYYFDVQYVINRYFTFYNRIYHDMTCSPNSFPRGKKVDPNGTGTKVYTNQYAKSNC